MKRDRIPLADIWAAVREAGGDADKAKEIMRSDDNQFARQNWVRAYFAWVELVCFVSRQAVLNRKYVKRVIRPADIPEFSALSEVRYTLEAGRIVEQPTFGRTLDQIVLSITAVSALFGIRLRVDRRDKAWNDARAALQVRDRVTHPKSSQAFQVGDGDVKAVEAFHNWFAAQLFVMGNVEVVVMLKRESAIAKRTKRARRLTIDVSKYEMNER